MTHFDIHRERNGENLCAPYALAHDLPMPLLQVPRAAENFFFSVRVWIFITRLVPYSHGPNALSGGEFSSLHQNNFHHYRDFWEFDISTHSWERIDTKVRPSARSGHRWVKFKPILGLSYYVNSMAMWKQYIVLFGGFIDPGFTSASLPFACLCATCDIIHTAKYLNDTWIFDTQQYKWQQIEFKETDRKPS
jgi:hypothetical protein